MTEQCGVCGRKHVNDVLRRLRSHCYECRRADPDDEQTPALAECMRCGELDCPHNEPLHYHHDGCPACMTDDRCGASAARIPLERATPAPAAGSVDTSRLYTRKEVLDLGVDETELDQLDEPYTWRIARQVLADQATAPEKKAETVQPMNTSEVELVKFTTLSVVDIVCKEKGCGRKSTRVGAQDDADVYLCELKHVTRVPLRWERQVWRG